MSGIRKSEIDKKLFIEQCREAGSLRKLAAQLDIPAGTLSCIAWGTRKPNASHRRKLIKAGLMPAPTPAIPWRRVAVWLADNPANLIGALKMQGVDQTRAEEIAARIWE